MKEVRQYLHYSSRSQHYTRLYQVAVGTSNFLAITCLFFGAAFASLGCCRFQRHRVRCEDGTGGGSWSDGDLPVSSSLRQ
jgi:hypothetical protein